MIHPDQLEVFLDCLHGSRYVHRDSSTDILFIWRGGHTVNVWHASPEHLEEIDVASVGDSAQSNATLEEVEEYIERYLAEWD